MSEAVQASGVAASHDILDRRPHMIDDAFLATEMRPANLHVSTNYSAVTPCSVILAQKLMGVRHKYNLQTGRERSGQSRSWAVERLDMGPANGRR